jgi:protein ImuB
VTALEPHFEDLITLGRVLARAAYNASIIYPQVGIARDPFTAQMAAQNALPGQVIILAEGDERDFLSPLLLDNLSLDEWTRDTMMAAGLLTLGDLAGLSSSVVLDRFGLAGVRAHRLARAEVDRPLRPRQSVSRESSRQTFEMPIYESLRLRALAAIQVRDLAERLRVRGLHCARVRLTGELATDDILQSNRRLSTPTSSPTQLIRMADDALAEWPLALGIIALTVALDTEPKSEPKDTVLRFPVTRRPSQ